MDRAINELGAKGIQLFTNVNGKPLDDAGVPAVFDEMARATADLAAPGARRRLPDYPTEKSRSTRSGGRSAGRTKPAPPWRAWSSRDSSTATRT